MQAGIPMTQSKYSMTIRKKWIAVDIIIYQLVDMMNYFKQDLTVEQRG